MSFLIWCELVCHNCADTVSGGYTSSNPSRRQMKNDARECGWIFKKNGETYCSQHCVDKWTEIQARNNANVGGTA